MILERGMPLASSFGMNSKIQSRGKRDHTEFMVIALQLYGVYGGSILGFFPVENVLPGKRIPFVPPLLVSM
jgi:hypothetical protein